MARTVEHGQVLTGDSLIGSSRRRKEDDRLLRGEVAERHTGFYSESEYDLAPLLAAQGHRRLLELGRSCVLPPYRNKRTVELLWHGIWTYVLRNKVDVMLGCASLEGTDPEALADAAASVLLAALACCRSTNLACSTLNSGSPNPMKSRRPLRGSGKPRRACNDVADGALTIAY